MKEAITSYVGLDIHKDFIAIAVAQAGRTTPRFVGNDQALAFGAVQDAEAAALQP